MQYNDTIYYNSSIWTFLKSDIVYQYGECNDPVIIDEEGRNCSIIISPNPFTNRLNISGLPENEVLQLKILNIFGMAVYDKTLYNIQQDPVELYTARLSSGIYILIINSNDKLLLTR